LFWTDSPFWIITRAMLNALASTAASQPRNTFLLVQEIVDEVNYNRLTENIRGLHTLCLGESDKVRLVFSDDPPDRLSMKVFDGLDRQSKALLMLLCDRGVSPRSMMTPAGLRAA
jgi:hypothetical protein